MKMPRGNSLTKLVFAAFFAVLLLVWFGKKYDKKVAMHENIFSIEQVHNAITQESEWFNIARPLQAADLKGRIVLLDFWTFCCINCIHVIPELKALEEKFGNKLTIIGVHSGKFTNEKGYSGLKQAVLRYDITHPVVNDSAYKIWNNFKVRAWPTLILVDPEGKIQSIYSGEGHQKEIESDIELLLKKYNQTIVATPLAVALEKDKTTPTVLLYPGKVIYTQEYSGQPALFISDSSHHQILGIRTDGTVFAKIGTGQQGKKDGNFQEAQFNRPQGLLFKENILYVADTGNHLVRTIDLSTKVVQTIAGTGKRGELRVVENASALTTDLASPWDLALYPSDHEITIAMAGSHQLWVYNVVTQTLNVIAGNGAESIDDGVYPLNTLAQPSGLSVFKDKLYFVDAESSSLRVLQNGKVTTLLSSEHFDLGFGQGTKEHEKLQHPLGLCAHPAGVIIADSYNHVLRFYDVKTKTLKIISGNGKPGDHVGTLLSTQYNEPSGIAKGEGNVFYIADTNNNRILVLDLSRGMTSVLAIAKQ